MKHLLQGLGLLLTLTAACTVHAQTPSITNSNYQDSCSRFSGNQLTTYTIISATPANFGSCRLETNHGDGSKMDTTTIAYSGTPGSYYTTTWHQYTTPGTYTIKKVLIAGGIRVDSLNTTVNIACSIIGGNIYNDLNSNCTFNTATEQSIRSAVQIRVDSAGVPVDTVYAMGYWRYAIRAAAATTYTFTLLNTPVGYVRSCPSSGVITYAFTPSSLPPLNRDFGFGCSAGVVYDYSLSYTRVLRGATSSGPSFIRLFAANHSCHSGTGTVTLQVSPKYTITTSGITPAPASVSGNTVTWTIANMAHSYITMLYVPLSPLSTTHNGDTACNSAIINPTSGDGNPGDNVISACDSVRASWDPNEKAVSPSGPVTAGTTLTYTIDFENLGNDTAFNIHVQDTLSPYLDAGTFQLVSATHNMSPMIYEISGGRRVIKFDFPNIRLEDKSVPDRNKGQVVFTMKMRSDLADGTVVANRAGIYFDGNPVVLTNTAYSRIPAPAGIEGNHASDGIRIYPNPAREAVHIEIAHSGWQEAILTNTVGQMITRIQLTSGVNVLRLQHLPEGIYYLQTKGSAGHLTRKIIKY